jgi:hypothetical protein
MFNIQDFLTYQSKLPMNYKHLSQVERYQIHSLMKAGGCPNFCVNGVKGHC